MRKTVACNSARTAGRLSKAEQFERAAQEILVLAEDAETVGDAYVTLAVHAGVAAADVICCVELGEYARGSDHRDAVSLLREARAELAPSLEVLLVMKPRAGYDSEHVTASQRRQAERAMKKLMNAARASVGG